MGDLRETFMLSIERDYGPYQVRECDGVGPGGESERDRIRRWLFSRFEQSREVFAGVFDAIKENIQARYGVPDLATIKRAVEIYQEEYGVRLYSRPDLPRFDVVRRTEEDEADSAQIRQIAQDAGINTDKDGWLARYIFQTIARRREAEKVSA